MEINKDKKTNLNNLYHAIIDYLIQSPNHERKKTEIIKKFKINKSTFKWHLIKMTYKYSIYENDTGRIIGIIN